MSETKIRDDMVRFSRSLFERGFSVGTAGNISVRVADGFLITPTNSCLGFLDAKQISKVGLDWNFVSGSKPSKELSLHRAFYETRPQVGAVVHLHSTYATALSCLTDIDPDNCVPALTPYVVMRVGQVKLVPYFRPGSDEGGEHIRALNGRCAAALLANHGTIVSGKDLVSAVSAAEELEETAKLCMLLNDRSVRGLTRLQTDDLINTFSVI